MSIGITMKKLYKDITYNGRETGIFEKELVKYTGSEHAIATNSGTSALFLILKAMGISKGDKVVTQAYSFVATANAIKYCGAVLTSNPELAKKILTLSTTAKDYSNNIYYHSELGYNMRMPALNAIHGVRQLKNIDYVKATKIQIEKSPYQCINTFPMYQDCDCMDLPVSTAISAKGKGLAYENCIYSA